MPRGFAAPAARRFAALANLLLAGALLYLGGKIGLSARMSLVAVLLIGAFLGLALLSAAAGLGLWRGTVLGAFLTLVVQGTQLVQGETHTLTYTTSLPLSWVVGVANDGKPVSRAHWRPALEITPDDDPDRIWVGLNLPALAAIVIAAATLGRGRTEAHPKP
jgi:hypothetical protein